MYLFDLPAPVIEHGACYFIKLKQVIRKNNFRYIKYIKVDNSLLKKVESYNHLGITTDSNLNWIEHLEGLKTKLLKS